MKKLKRIIHGGVDMKIGDNTNAFHSPEDVIALAKEVCKARFKGNWILKIVDYSGKDLDEEILIDKL